MILVEEPAMHGRQNAMTKGSAWTGPPRPRPTTAFHKKTDPECVLAWHIKSHSITHLLVRIALIAAHGCCMYSFGRCLSSSVVFVSGKFKQWASKKSKVERSNANASRGKSVRRTDQMKPALDATRRQSPSSRHLNHLKRRRQGSSTCWYRYL